MSKQRSLFPASRLDEIAAEAARFHEDHPNFWRLFVRFTNERIAMGFKHYSVNAIFERIRWESDVAESGESTFKINNNYRAFYARLFMRTYPEYSGFFRTRVQTSAGEDATLLPPLGPDHFPTWPQPPRQIAP